LYADYSKVIIGSNGYCIWERVGTKSFTGFLILLLTFALAFAFEVQLVKSEFASESERYGFFVVPEVVELGPENVTGQTFSIAVIVENMSYLVGVDVEFRYDPAYLDYVSHTLTMPVEDFPDPISPSPYPGTLHNPPLPLVDQMTPSTGSYWVAFATLGGPSFNGSGTVFVMTFRVRSQPALGEEDTVVNLDILWADILVDVPHAPDIPFVPWFDGTVIIHAFAPTIGGSSFSIESKHLSSWLASTLLIVAFFSASCIYFRRRHV